MKTLLLLLALCASACTSGTPITKIGIQPAVAAPVTATATPPTPAVTAPVPVSRPYDGHVLHFAAWTPNAGAPDPAFTNTIMLQWNCDDPQAADRDLRARATTDSRTIILHLGLMGWGNEGYAIVDPSVVASCWPIERAFIRDYRSRIIEVHTSDEPPDVAWSYWQNGAYNPNRYNDDLTAIASIVHNDFPDLVVAVNYGSVPPGLVVPAGINHVWLETYDAAWHTKLDTLAGITSLPLALMPPGFVIGDPATLDAQETAIVNAVWIEAQANPRVTLLVFFIPCCDDTTTGDKNFYTVGGGRLPLTLAALQFVGATFH